MLAIIGVAVFWLAGQLLLAHELFAGLTWVLMLVMPIACGVLAWYGDYGSWGNRMLHFVALLLLCAAYAAVWEDAVALMVEGWQQAMWYGAGVALPLVMALGGPARDVFVDGDDD